MPLTYEEACLVVRQPDKLVDEAGEFWRRTDPIIDNGVLKKGGMFAHQREWWDLPNMIRLLVGGYGSGKTLIGCKRIIANALENAPCDVATVSPTFPLARHTVIRTISDLLKGKQTLYGRRNFRFRYNKSTHEFRIRFRGREAHIICYSGEDPDSLRGPNLASAYLDEPFLMDEAVFKQMIARVRHPEALRREILLTGTPEQLNWGYSIAEGEDKGKYDLGVVTASTRLNRALDPGYVGRLEGAFDGKVADAYIDGRFVNLSTGLVYHAFSTGPGGHVQDLEIPNNAELGVGMDFNVNPMACVVFWRAGSHIHVFKEYEFPNADTEYVCSVLGEEWVKGRPSNVMPLENIYPDATGSARKTAAPAGRSDFWYIRQAGFNVCARSTNPNRRDRYNAVNGKFKPKAGKTTLTISPKCKKLIKYLNLYSHELINKQEAMSHLLDALGYPISYLFPVDHDSLSTEKLTGV